MISIFDRLILLKKVALVIFATLSFNVIKADILLNETFTTGVLPVGWTNNVIQGTQGWIFRNSPVFGSISGGNYTVFDDFLLGAGVTPNEAALTTNSINCSNRTAIYLSYSHHWLGVEFTHGYVEVSNDGGIVWNTIKDYEKITKGTIAVPQDTIINISAFAANQANVKVRFRYTDGGQAGRYWYLDDVKIYAEPDAGVSKLVQPNYLGCAQSYGANETVTVEITNYGVTPITNIPVTCQVTGGTIATLSGTYVGPLIPQGGTANYTFASTINMTIDTVYHFLSYTTLGTDEYVLNDTLLTGRRQYVQSYTDLEQFDYSDAGWREYGSTANRHFVHGIVPYLSGAQGNGKSWYTSVVADPWQDFYVESPIYDFTNVINPTLSLDAKFNLSGHPSWQYVRVEYSINGGTSWSILGAATDPNWYNTPSYYWYGNQPSWKKYQKTLCNLIGQSCVKFRFHGYIGSVGVNAQFAFDNFKIIDSTDVGVIAFVEPVNIGCLFSTNQQVTVTVANWSCSVITNVPITTTITGAATTTLNGIVPSIPANSSINYTFPTTFDMTALGIYNFDSYTTLISDGDNSNDTSTTSINVNQLKISTFPYVEDFNANDGVWVVQNQTVNRKWTWGAVPYLAGPSGNINSWYIEFNGDLWNSVYLESPVFDFTQNTKPVLSFDVMHNLVGHPSWQYVRVEYSLDGGVSWVTLGNATDPNWYNTPSYYWYGNQPTWTNVVHDLCQLSGESCVKLRLNAYCGSGGANAQFAFDNITIDDGTGDDLEPILIYKPDGGDCAYFGAAENVGVLIQNNTCRPLTNVPIVFNQTGPISQTIIDTIPGPIPRFGRYYHTFSTTIDMSASGTYNLQASISSNLSGTGLSYINDTFPSNNSITEVRYANSVNTYTANSNFNTNNDGWASYPLSQVNNYFNRDTVPYLGGAQGKGKSWYLDVNGDLWKDAYVESPIYNFSSLTNPILYMDVKYQLNGHPSWQYARVEYSTNGGTSWATLGTATDPNWYNQPSYYFYGTQNTWKTVQHSLCNLSGQSCVKFRVHSYVGTISNSYFAFDNFTIRDSIDVGVIAYIDPVDVGCLFGQQQQVTVKVFNWSCVPISNIPITSDITGQITTTLTGVVPGPIPAQSSINYTFPTTFNMTPTGIYNFSTYTNLTGDGYLGNDTLNTTINVNQLKVTTYPYFEDFDTSAGFWLVQNAAVGRNWIRGAVPYLAGPSGNVNSWYLDFTANLWNPVYVESPVYDFSAVTNPTFSMDIMYNLSGHPSWQYGRVEYSINGGVSWATLGNANDPNWYNTPSYYWYGNQPTWKNVEHNLCIVSGESCVKFRVTAYCGSGGANAYFAFDNVRVTDGRGDDLEPILIYRPDGADCSGFNATEAVGVLIRNNTCRSLTNVPVDLNLTGANTQTFSETILGPIPAMGKYYYTFTNTLNMSVAGNYNIEVITNSNLTGIGTDYINDTNATNDSHIETRYFNAINTFPYTANFDVNNDGWASAPLSAVNRVFMLDTVPYLGGSQGNGRSWYLDVTGDLWQGSWVESPVFDLSTAVNPMLSMDIKYYLSGHPSWQYVRVEYSINGGTSWTTLGNATEPNWYNTPSYYWYGTDSSWTNVQHTLCNLSGQSCVKFRIYGYVGSGTTNARFAFDNFKIIEATDVGITAFIEPLQNQCLYTDSQQVTVRLYNWSCSPVTGIPVVCNVTGANTTTLSTTFTGSVGANGFVDITFPITFDMTALGNYYFTAYTNVVTEINRLNDTIRQTINVPHLRVDTFDYFEDFNTTQGYGEWLNLNNTANRNWKYGIVPYLGGAQGLGNSWYIDFSGDLWNNVYLESPVYDFTNVTNPIMTFEEKHNLSGHPSWQYVRVEYTINGGTTWIVLGNATDPQWYNQVSYYWYGNQASWNLVRHNLCTLVGQNCVKFRISAYCGSGGVNAQFAFDNFHITDTPLDAALNLVASCWGSQYEIEATVTNIALPCTITPTLSSFDVTYSIDGGAPVTVPFTGQNIAGGSSTTVTLPNTLISNTSSSVVAWINFPNTFNDQIFENDSAYGYAINWPNCNDHCSNAIDLGLGTTTASQTSNGTVDSLEDPNYSGCGAITVENTVWYQFTTNNSGDSITIVFDSQSCSPSQNGIQISIDSATTPCDFTTYTNMFCSATNDTTAITWGPTLLPPNTTYYIAIDGFAGSDCDFNINITGAVNPPLPIKLLSFIAVCAPTNGAVDLKWLSASEINNDFYTIERSADAINFEAIATVKGAGNSSNINSYFFRDMNALDGVSYYRLKQTDFNGNFEYFNIEVVNCINENSLVSIYPNPATHSFNIKMPNVKGKEITIELFNNIGQLVIEESFKSYTPDVNKEVNVEQYEPGIYFIKITINNEIYNQKIIIKK